MSCTWFKVILKLPHNLNFHSGSGLEPLEMPIAVTTGSIIPWDWSLHSSSLIFIALQLVLILFYKSGKGMSLRYNVVLCWIIVPSLSVKTFENLDRRVCKSSCTNQVWVITFQLSLIIFNHFLQVQFISCNYNSY